MPSRMSRLARTSRLSRGSKKSADSKFARQSTESGLQGRIRRKPKNNDPGRPQKYQGPS